MERNVILKFVYEDSGITKVVKGRVINEDDFTYTIKPINGGSLIILGKRNLIQAQPVRGAF